MQAIVVNIAQKFWKKYFKHETDILKYFDKFPKNKYKYIHFKLPQKPVRTFDYVMTNLGGKWRGSIKKHDVIYMNKKELKKWIWTKTSKRGFLLGVSQLHGKDLKKKKQKKSLEDSIILISLHSIETRRNSNSKCYL